MHELAESIIERIVPNADGSLPDPSINRLTGKPNLPAAEPTPAPSNLKPGGSTVEYGGETYDVMVFGDKSIRPRIARSDKVVSAKVYTMGNKMFVLLDAPAQEGVAEGHRDYNDNRTGFGDQGKREFKRREMEHELGHETNNYAVAIDGKTWKVFATKSHAESVARSLQNKGKKATVHATGSPVSESATAGATSAANVGVGAVYNNKPVKQPKNKDGTAKNAVDMKGVNLLTGGSLKR